MDYITDFLFQRDAQYQEAKKIIQTACNAFVASSQFSDARDEDELEVDERIQDMQLARAIALVERQECKEAFAMLGRFRSITRLSVAAIGVAVTGVAIKAFFLATPE